MKKIVPISIVLFIALLCALILPTLAGGYIELVDEGVPTLIMPEKGFAIIDADGSILESALADDILLTAYKDFDDVQNMEADELRDLSSLPYLIDNARVDLGEDCAASLFDFELKGEAKTAFNENEGNSMNLKFEVDNVTKDSALVAQYVNGNWVALDKELYTVEEGVMDIHLENEGMLAFLRYKWVSTAEESASPSPEVTESPAPTETPVYRPSVEYKPVPEPVPDVDETEDEDGNKVESGYWVLVSVMANLADAEDRVDAKDIKLTPADELTLRSQQAYVDLEKAQKLDEVCSNIGEVCAQLGDDLTVDDLVVRDVFEVAFTGAAARTIMKSGESALLLHFKYNLEGYRYFLVMEYSEDHWEALDPDCFAVLEDGIVSVKLTKPGVLAFIVAP